MAVNSAPFSIVLIHKVVSIEPKGIAKKSMTVNIYNEYIKESSDSSLREGIDDSHNSNNIICCVTALQIAA